MSKNKTDARKFPSGMIHQWFAKNRYRIREVDSILRLEEEMHPDQWVMIALDETHDALLAAIVPLLAKTANQQQFIDSVIAGRRKRAAGVA